MRLLAPSVAVVLSVVGCAYDQPSELVQGKYGPEAHRDWDDRREDPSLLSGDLVRTFDDLPTSGTVASMPWPGGYWPYHQDGINFRYASPDTPSPAEKYAAAFEVPGLTQRTSARNGVQNVIDRYAKVEADARAAGRDPGLAYRTCVDDRDCAPLTARFGDHFTCATRTGASEGVCAMTWEGIAHAWAAASVLEPEPRQAVTFNGTTFEIDDIKALLSISYDEGVDVRFLSTRCTARPDAKPAASARATLSFDEIGSSPTACDDRSAGQFHIAIANYLGLRHQPLIEDRTYDSQVWNQPLRHYEITHSETIGRARAADLLGRDEAAGAFHADATQFRYVEMRLDWIGESHPMRATERGYLGSRFDPIWGSWGWFDRYQYVLELDDKGRILQGGWVGNSRTTHPDFLWVPVGKRTTAVAADGDNASTGIRWEVVEALSDLASHAAPKTGFDWSGAAGTRRRVTWSTEVRTAKAIGIIPAGTANVRLRTRSFGDVDLQLWDENRALVEYQTGVLRGDRPSSAIVDTMDISWSGGMGLGPRPTWGHEEITIRGTLPRDLIVKIKGYHAGHVEVEYGWGLDLDSGLAVR